MAESVDALVSNTSRFTPVPVRPRLWVLREVREDFSFFCLYAVRMRVGVVQSVAVWHRTLGSAIIAIAISCLCLMIVFEN